MHILWSFDLLLCIAVLNSVPEDLGLQVSHAFVVQTLLLNLKLLVK